MIERRWSQGFVTGIGGKYKMIGTTADNLNGNSGGPAVNDSGELVGISSRRAKKEGEPYTGNESAVPMVWHSLLERCEGVAAFIASALPSSSAPAN